jgi:uncharacterized protein (DUF983 family)
MITRALEERDKMQSLARGLRGLCPACGKGQIFSAYLKVNDTCAVCGEELHHHRADDAPPYLTIFVVGHIVAGVMLTTEPYLDHVPLWAHSILWSSIVLILCLWMLPLIKGALIAWQWALKMHGFEIPSLITPSQKSPAPQETGGGVD